MCKTLVFFTILKQLVNNDSYIKTLNIDINDIKTIEVAGKDEKSENHIFIGINLTDNRNSSNIRDYFCFEVTSETKDKTLPQIYDIFINQHNNHSIYSDDYNVSNTKLYYKIISQYLLTNMSAIIDWVGLANKDHDKYYHLISDMPINYSIIAYDESKRLIAKDKIVITFINRLDSVLTLLNGFNNSCLIRTFIMDNFINKINKYYKEIDSCKDILNKQYIFDKLSFLLTDFTNFSKRTKKFMT